MMNGWSVNCCVTCAPADPSTLSISAYSSGVPKPHSLCWVFYCEKKPGLITWRRLPTSCRQELATHADLWNASAAGVFDFFPH